MTPVNPEKKKKTSVLSHLSTQIFQKISREFTFSNKPP